MPSVHTIIVAAGSGTRFGADLPKQFCLLAGRPVLMHTIDRIRLALPDSEITLVLASEMVGYWEDLCHTYGYESPRIVHGGSSRSESVRNALRALPQVPDIVLVHDGARPLVDAVVVHAVVEAALKADGAIPAVAVTDSLRRGKAECSEAVDRSGYYAVQTPQAFRGKLLVDAYNRDDAGYTDDASLMEHAGYSHLLLTAGSPVNIKITHPRDIVIAEALLK